MASSVNERELVMEILLSVTRDGEYSHIALRNVLNKYQYLDINGGIAEVLNNRILVLAE